MKFMGWVLSMAAWLILASAVCAQPAVTARQTLDDTDAFIHLTPGWIETTNGCADFTVTVIGTFTDARVFGLRFSFDQSSLELISVVPGDDPTLHIMPELLEGNVLELDGFFHPNFAGGNVTLATLHIRAIAPDDATTLIGFATGEGLGGTEESPDPIAFTGDTTYVGIEGTPALSPQHLIIQRLTYPANDDSVRLMWNRVYYDAAGDTLVNPLYVVYREDVMNNPYVYDSVGAVLDTSYYDDFVRFDYFPGDTGLVNEATFYVRTCKTRP